MQLDEERALRILEKECERSQDESEPVLWEERIRKLCSMSEKTSKTYIAAFGTQALAKATNLRAYTLSKNVGDKDGGYSARGFCKRVLAAEAPRLGIDLGVTGREPLNNQPFFYVTYMDEARDTVKGPALEAFDHLIELLRDLNEVQSEDKARQILRAFLRLRIQEERSVPDVSVEGLTDDTLISMVASFVSDESEGGKRAQAATTAMFDAAYSSEKVVTERINDPDRHLTGDVGVYINETDNTPLLAVEVRDKPIEASDVFHFVQKVGTEGIRRACVVAVSDRQNESVIHAPDNKHEILDFAREHNVRLRVYSNWKFLIESLVFYAQTEPREFASRAYQAVLERSNQLEVSDQGLEMWAEYGKDFDLVSDSQTTEIDSQGQFSLWRNRPPESDSN